MQSEAWRDLPRIPDELPEKVEHHMELLRAMAATIDLRAEGEARARLIRQVEEGYIVAVATTAWLVIRVMEWASENKAVEGAAKLSGIAALLLALIGLFYL